MIELQIVNRMLRRGLFLAPVIVALAALFGGTRPALSAGIGAALAIGNLWLAGRVIGGVAENRPELLMPAAMGAFTFGLIVLTVAAVFLKKSPAVAFPVTGVTLVGVHLFLVFWEASDAFLRLPARSSSADVRS